jgi:hypothetical protein
MIISLSTARWLLAATLLWLHKMTAIIGLTRINSLPLLMD